MAATVLRRLEREVHEAGARPRPRGAAPVPTGIPALDALLPGGGLPRGRAVEWLGPRSCGKTALLRAVLGRLRAAGEAVAIVDPGGTLYAPDWAPASAEGLLWVVRPPHGEAAWCADLLLRSGAFGAVALELDDPPSGAAAVRLQRLAEEAGAVFVVVGRAPRAALRLRFRPGRLEPLPGAPFGPFLPVVRPVWTRVEKGGESEVPILCPRPPERARPSGARDRKGPP